MFENIPLIYHNVTKPITPMAIDYKLAAALEQSTSCKEPFKQQELPDNMKNADFFLSGKLEAFSRPPITDFALKNLYHMEAFSIFHCDKNFFTKRKDYLSYLILYTYEGNGLLEYGGKAYHLSTGDGFFIDCRLPHLYQADGDYWKHSVFHLNGSLLPNIFHQYIQNGSAMFSQSITGHYQSELEKLLSIYSAAQPYRDWQAADCISNMLTDLLINSYNDNAKHSSVPENLQYLIKYMETNFSSALTLDFLAKFSGLSKYYLSREFKKYTGFSPNDYLIQLRVEHAKFLLQSTTMPINAIAHTTGIHDINNFINLFKKKTGMTPGQYRKGMVT